MVWNHGILWFSIQLGMEWKIIPTDFHSIIFQRGGGASTNQISKNLRLSIPSGKLSHNYGKSLFLMGRSTISMAIFNSYFYRTRWYQSKSWNLLCWPLCFLVIAFSSVGGFTFKKNQPAEFPTAWPMKDDQNGPVDTLHLIFYMFHWTLANIYIWYIYIYTYL